MPLKYLAVTVLTATLFLSTARAGAEEFDLQFKISPAKGRIRPLSEPVSLAVTVARTNGQPAPEGRLLVQLDAPPPGMFISTDFPVVEGTRLLEMSVPLVNGRAEWRQIFPIRGKYRLEADFETTAGSKTVRVFQFTVSESPWKWLVLAGVALGLFIAGIVGARIFSSPRAIETAPFVSISALVLSCACAMAGQTSAREQPARNPRATLEIASATVGKPARILWRLDPAGADGKLAAELSLTITHLEKNLTVFALDKLPVAGEFAFDYQFTDGSDHRVTGVAKTVDGTILRQERSVSVNAAPPPMRAKLQATILFLAIIAAGLALGRWSRVVSGGGEPNPRRPA